MSGDGSDEQLARQAAAGDREALASLLDVHYDRIHRMAWHWCGSAEAAQDVAQDVCVKLATSIGKFRADAAFATWVWRITYNAAVDHLRLANKLQATAPAEMMALVDQPTGDTPEAEALTGDLWMAVRGLPPQQRDAVLLVYAQDMSHAEAAGILDCSTNTVSWHLHEARKALKAQLEAAE
jgi:RNA polymerase sigma-70 factor (ECF subfamily)